MKKVLVWSGSIVALLIVGAIVFSFFFGDQAINHLKAEQKKSAQKVDEMVKSSEEMGRYADCVVAAATDAAQKQCDEMTKTFSERTQKLIREQAGR